MVNEDFEVEFAGHPIVIKDKTYILPSFGLDVYEQPDAFKKIQAVTKAISPLVGMSFGSDAKTIFKFISEADIAPEVFGYISELLYRAVKRNYPDIEMEYEEFQRNLNLMQGLSYSLLVIAQSQPVKRLENLKNSQPQQTKKKKTWIGRIFTRS